MSCAHMNFQCVANVTRLTDTDDGPVTGYATDIRITCADCALPFRFMGLAAGYHFAEPRVNVDATQLRAPIEPAYVTEILGMPLVAGHA